MVIDSREKASKAKKAIIIFLSVFCAFVFLLCLAFFLTIEPIEHPDYSSKNIFFTGVATLVMMMVMFGLGTFTVDVSVTSLDSWLRSGFRFLIRIIVAILIILLVCILMG